MFWFIFKIILLLSLAILVRGTLPRYRIDQLISLNWKNLIYIYIFFFLLFFNWILIEIFIINWLYQILNNSY